ncbi:MAG TPA: CHASE3 domain-containing protein [Telluria sp.]|nr:CHASE3 domain-containing protein [Telluria sp.]
MHFTTAADDRPRRSLPLYQTLLCLACVLILVVNGVSLLRNLESLKAANALQQQTARVTDELQALSLLVTDAESNMRGYFLSGSQVYLGPARAAEAQVAGQFAKLKTLLADNPSQLKSLAQLRFLVDNRLDMMHQAEQVYRKGGLHDIAAIAKAADGMAQLDEIRLQVVIMSGEQRELLATRREAYTSQYGHTVWLGLGINAAAIVVIVLFYQLIRRSFAARHRAEHALQQANDQLESMVALRTEQLAVLSRHLIRVAEEEKTRLSRELHDEMGANLTAIGMDLAAVGERVQADAELAAMVTRARAKLVDTVQLKRRIVEDLRPSLLDNMGLATALRSYCEDYARVTGIACDALVDDAVDQASPTQAIALFRIAQEALNNVAKYAHARNVTVALSREADGIALEVADDGIGIPPDALSGTKSHGLLGMRERALLLGGSLTVKRGGNGAGTCVLAFIPAGEAAPETIPAPVGSISAPHP